MCDAIKLNIQQAEMRTHLIAAAEAAAVLPENEPTPTACELCMIKKQNCICKTADNALKTVY